MPVTEAYSDEGYCEPEDVERFFRVEEGFNASTNPTRSQVEDMILEWSDEIDNRTKHAWRERQVKNEYHDLDDTPYYFGSGTPIKLYKRRIKALDGDKGDKLEIWSGNEWEDWVADSSHRAGRNNDWWIDEGNGLLYVYRRYATWSEPAVRITYRYGSENTPRDVKKACAKYVAADLAMTDQYAMNVPGTDGAADVQSQAQQWREDAEKTLARRTETQVVQGWG
ncbi:hypothetical protein HCTV-16_gp121 [Haloarcula virus HCTV-16]|nr:hypothetical protein HCTV-16_gp121 [Haloarcula virus HCTV-16]